MVPPPKMQGACEHIGLDGKYTLRIHTWFPKHLSESTASCPDGPPLAALRSLASSRREYLRHCVGACSVSDVQTAATVLPRKRVETA